MLIVFAENSRTLMLISLSGDGLAFRKYFGRSGCISSHLNCQYTFNVGENPAMP